MCVLQMLKTLRNIPNHFILLALIAMVFLMCSCGSREGFASIGTVGGMAPREVFAAKHDLSCVAGPSKNGYYSKSLTPGGFCGLQEKVRASHTYEIEDGPYGKPLA